MKLIIAYVQPGRLNAVKQALQDAEVGKMSVTNALGCGQQGGYQENYRGAVVEVNLLKKVRFEVAVNDEFVQVAVEAIIKGAKTGKNPRPPKGVANCPYASMCHGFEDNESIQLIRNDDKSLSFVHPPTVEKLS